MEITKEIIDFLENHVYFIEFYLLARLVVSLTAIGTLGGRR